MRAVADRTHATTMEALEAAVAAARITVAMV
jgi:hypothetical protein